MFMRTLILIDLQSSMLCPKTRGIRVYLRNSYTKKPLLVEVCYIEVILWIDIFLQNRSRVKNQKPPSA